MQPVFAQMQPGEKLRAGEHSPKTARPKPGTDEQRQENAMNEVARFLQENPAQHLAAVSREGSAGCRPSGI